jgi:hypothetical protein
MRRKCTLRYGRAKNLCLGVSYSVKASLLDLIKIIWLADPLLKILANIGPAPLGDSTVKINDTYLCLMGIVT